MKVLLLHMANKPTATVMARKLRATIHLSREVVGVVPVLLIFVLSLSFPAAGPTANREKNKISEKRLRQEAANMRCLLSPVPEHTLLESSREEGESPEPSWEKVAAGSALPVEKGSSSIPIDLGMIKGPSPSACRCLFPCLLTGLSVHCPAPSNP